MRNKVFLILGVLCASVLLTAQAKSSLDQPAPNSIFDSTRVGVVRLTLTASEFAALTPAGGGGFAFGGFGVGADLMWEVEGVVGINLTRSIFTEVGYRALGVDYENNGLLFDAIMHGPQITTGITF